jgi:hypothetical protein
MDSRHKDSRVGQKASCRISAAGLFSDVAAGQRPDLDYGSYFDPGGTGFDPGGTGFGPGGTGFDPGETGLHRTAVRMHWP